MAAEREQRTYSRIFLKHTRPPSANRPRHHTTKQARPKLRPRQRPVAEAECGHYNGYCYTSSQGYYADYRRRLKAHLSTQQGLVLNRQTAEDKVKIGRAHV